VGGGGEGKKGETKWNKVGEVNGRGECGRGQGAVEGVG